MSKKNLENSGYRITVLLMGAWLVGCAGENSRPAAISTVGEGERNVTQSRASYNRSYDSIPKGSYNNDTYKVKPGDTLFYIAWIAGKDFRDLAQRNNLSEPYHLEIGQVLKIANTGSNTKSRMSLNGSSSATASAESKRLAVVDPQPVNAYDSERTNKKTLSSSSTLATPAVGRWLWPTEGKIIDNFSSSEGGNKGIDISGSRGQAILATAAGRVVYAGSALRGYGNLIIIKHDDDYLSAYAHNDNILVREQEDIKVGQKIATMGSTGASSVRLHFEIRYKGKSVNPLRYLPQR